MRQLNKSAALNSAELAEYLENVNTRLMNHALSSAGLAIGSSSKKAVLIANTVNYLVDGVFCAKTTAEIAFTATTDDIAASAASVQEACYLLCLTSNGTASWVKGAVATGAGNAIVPEIPSGKTAIGYVRIAVAVGTTIFNATTDELDAGHLTVTYVNLGYVNNSFESAIL